MSATQVSAGLGLLKKVLPDLAASADTNADGELRQVDRMTDAELEAIAASSSNGTASPSKSKNLLN